jgi:hypothetical protein
MKKKKLPFGGLTETQISKLKAIGLKKSSDYYKLSYKEQLGLTPDIPLGAVPIDPDDPLYRCTELEPPLVPEPGITTPVVDWTWRTPFPGQEHAITTRPWWGYPDENVTNPNDAKFNEQQYWYPNPAQGWKVFGYMFGSTGGQLGYLLVYNIYTGIMRLFVYLPGVEAHNFNNLFCSVSITDPNHADSKLWSFPLQDIPPTSIEFKVKSQMEDMNGNAVYIPSFEQVPSSLTASWPGKDEPYHTLSSAVSGAFGVWLRTEIPTLYDPFLYPSTQPLRDLGGCLSIFFPGISNDPSLKPADRRMLHLRFCTAQVGDVELIANLSLDLSGKATPTVQEPGTIGVIKNTVLGAKAGISGAMSGLSALGIAASSGGGIAAIAAAGLAGAYFGMIDEGDPPPEYIVKMAGTATGTITGRVVTLDEATQFDLNFSKTFIPTFDGDGNSNPVGYPQNYQRCETIRFGTYGFHPSGRGDAYIDIDPRPSMIVIDWYTDQSLEFNIPFIVIQPIGYFQIAPWAEMDIETQSAQLEVISLVANPGDGLPYERTYSSPVPIQVDPYGEMLIRSDVSALASGVRDENKKVMIRWFAKIQPRDRTVAAFSVQYALDVSALMHFLPEPGTGTDEWPN